MSKHYTLVDPFNPQNTVEGHLDDVDSYGDIRIDKVNGIECRQYIHCTPKFNYPLDKMSIRPYLNSDKSFFTNIDRCIIYDKVDGTNVFMFHYDVNGKRYWSYKTRLTPFLRSDSAFGDFVKMWQMGSSKYDLAPIQANGMNCAFELYGKLNKILIEYPEQIDIKLLYFIDDNGKLFPPFNSFSLPIPFNYIPPRVNDEQYITQRQLLEETNSDVITVEGQMWYILQKGEWHAYKNKPDCVIAAQVEGSKGISYNDAYTTAINAMEGGTFETLLEDTKKLLLEEHDETKIQFFMSIIEKAVNDAIAYIKKRNTIIKVFTELKLDKITPENKGVIMREMMKHFDKKDSTFVYNILK